MFCDSQKSPGGNYPHGSPAIMAAESEYRQAIEAAGVSERTARLNVDVVLVTGFGVVKGNVITTTKINRHYFHDLPRLVAWLPCRGEQLSTCSPGFFLRKGNNNDQHFTR